MMGIHLVHLLTRWDLDLSVFDIVANHNETLSGPNVTIFYHSHLVTILTTPALGFPSMVAFLRTKAWASTSAKLEPTSTSSYPSRTFTGLVVIDWEGNWRPQWVRNWGSKDIYRNKSKELIRKLHPGWPQSKVENEAKELFERAGEVFMNSTLDLAESRRPHGLGGFICFLTVTIMATSSILCVTLESVLI